MAHFDFDLAYGLSTPLAFERGLQLLPNISPIWDGNGADDELPAQDPVPVNNLDPSTIILSGGLSTPLAFERGLQLLPNISPIWDGNGADDELPAQDPVPVNNLDPSTIILSGETSNASQNDLRAFQQQEQERFGTSSSQQVHMVSELPPENWDTESETDSNIEQDMMQVDSLEEDIVMMGVDTREGDTVEVHSMDQQDMERHVSQIVSMGQLVMMNSYDPTDLELVMMNSHDPTDLELFNPSFPPDSDLQEQLDQVQGKYSVGAQPHLNVLIQKDSEQVDPVLLDGESEVSGAANNDMEQLVMMNPPDSTDQESFNPSSPPESDLQEQLDQVQVPSVGAQLHLKVLVQEPVLLDIEGEASGAANNVTESVLPEHQAPISSPAGMPSMDYRYTEELSLQIGLKADAEVPVSLVMFPASDRGSASVKKADDNGKVALEGNHQ